MSDTLKPKTHIAVIVPVYNSLKTLPELIDRLEATLSTITSDYQIVLIDDCGPQPVWPVIAMHAKRNPRIVGLRLSRNFGQHAAITAGIKFANSDWYVVMDCDLQDRPEDVALLYQTAMSGNHDSVLAVRGDEDVGTRKKLGSRVFNFVLNKLADIPVSTDVGNYRIFNQDMAEAYRMYNEQMRLFPALMSHLGFDVGRVEVKRPARLEGKSGYSFSKLFELAFDSIVSNTIKPVYYIATFGFLVALAAILYTVILVVRKLVFGISAEGWASTMAAILMLGGIQILVTSFVGIYVGKVFFQVKQRPSYILRETTVDRIKADMK
ncbi:glycosyltransferase family 2 protein [Litorimonas sp. WD9-15]|uniref:glycosyltransferase family 2 protein n=1 Tax=Litorimonas sp. WD9-15 TaxID=3418716 RepID=UPI003D0815F9